MEDNAVVIGIHEARAALRWCDSYSRMPTLIELGLTMDSADWHTVLGEEWSACDNIGAYRQRLRRMLPERGPVVKMMMADELAAWRELPETLAVYRGCGPKNLLGASWSLSRAVAERFPTLSRYRQASPLLVTAEVSKRRVLAVKLDRNEFEIVTFEARRVAVEPIQRLGLDGEPACTALAPS